jgi:hypothetical protein
VGIVAPADVTGVPTEPEPAAPDRTAGAPAGLLQEVFAGDSRRGRVRQAHPRLQPTGPRGPSDPLEGRRLRSSPRAARLYVRRTDQQHDMLEWPSAQARVHSQ